MKTYIKSETISSANSNDSKNGYTTIISYDLKIQQNGKSPLLNVLEVNVDLFDKYEF